MNAPAPQDQLSFLWHQFRESAHYRPLHILAPPGAGYKPVMFREGRVRPAGHIDMHNR